MKSSKSAVFLLITVLIGTLAFAGCGANNGFVSYKMASKQNLRFNMGPEPNTVDPALQTFDYETNVVIANFEGLARLNKTGEPIPGVASSWDISSDGKKYTFHLRDSKWSNGEPVTAEDFVFAWTRALNPQTASEYAYQLFYIKDAEKYNNGTANAEDLGIKAIDNKTLEVELETPVTYFLTLTAFPTYMPVNEKIVKANPDKWASEAVTYVGNGPFKMTAWKHKASMEWEKNKNYWDAENVKLDNMKWTIIETETAELNAFETGQIDIGYLEPPSAEIERLKKEDKFGYRPYTGIYFYDLNINKPPLDNVKVRKALNMSIDREAIVKQITRAGEKAAYAWVPYGLIDGKGDFRDVGGNNLVKYDVKTAQKLLADAGYPGGKGFPKVIFIYNTKEKHKVIAEAIQEMWKKNLGIDIQLQNMEAKVFIDSRAQKNFQIAVNGWVGDYLDPMAYIDYFSVSGGNSYNIWNNSEYNRLVDLAKTTNDQKQRIKAMHDAEKILFQEEPVIPLFYLTRSFVKENYVQNTTFVPNGFLDFKTTWIANH